MLNLQGPEVRRILREEGGDAVVAVLAGHSHRGGYVLDAGGVFVCTKWPSSLNLIQVCTTL